jgi:hypothetical protein
MMSALFRSSQMATSALQQAQERINVCDFPPGAALAESSIAAVAGCVGRSGRKS